MGNQSDAREGRTQATNKRQQQQQPGEPIEHRLQIDRSGIISCLWVRAEFQISSCSNLAPEKRERGKRKETQRRRSEAEPTKPPALRGCKGDRSLLVDQPCRPPIVVEPSKCEQVACHRRQLWLRSGGKSIERREGRRAGNGEQENIKMPVKGFVLHAASVCVCVCMCEYVCVCALCN